MAAGARRKALRQLRRQPRHVALQHGRPFAIQFFLERGDNGRMVVPDVMHAVAGEEIENAPAVRGEEFAARTALVARIHLQQVKQPNPLRIHVFGVHGVDRRDSNHGLLVGRMRSTFRFEKCASACEDRSLTVAAPMCFPSRDRQGAVGPPWIRAR